MISDIRDSTFSSSARISGEQLPQLVSELSRTNLAFGFVKVSENEFAFAASPAHYLQKIEATAIRETFRNNRGFLVFPFDTSRNPGYFIPALRQAGQIHPADYQKEKNKTAAKPERDTTEVYYKYIVEKAIEEIKEGKFQKLVPARRKILVHPDFDPGIFLKKLMDAYPQAHLLVFQLPGHGLWISASPEILLEQSIDSESIRTMALAGTRIFNECEDLKDMSWTEKEIEEQALVSGFIKSKLYGTGYSDFTEKGPFSVRAGNLVHLRTDFQIARKSESDFLKLAEILHPTPAVCGSPAAEAREWLIQHEGFGRSFFSGFAGMCGGDSDKLVVLLRICRIQGDELTFFAGAGVTALSNPEKEWMETGEKLKTLMTLL